MVMNGQSMQWAPKLTSLSWIRGSHRTTSSLSAPGSEAVVRALCAPQAYSCIAIGFWPSVSILVSRHVQRSLWRCLVTQRGAGMPAWQPSFKHFRQMCGHRSLWWKPTVRILVVSVLPHITLLSFLCFFVGTLPELENSFYAKGWCSRLRGILQRAMRKLLGVIMIIFIVVMVLWIYTYVKTSHCVLWIFAVHCISIVYQ